MSSVSTGLLPSTVVSTAKLPMFSVTFGVWVVSQTVHDDMNLSSWTVCDTTQTPKVTENIGSFAVETTVLGNNPVLTDDIRAATPAQMLLTQTGNTTFLIYNG